MYVSKTRSSNQKHKQNICIDTPKQDVDSDKNAQPDEAHKKCIQGFGGLYGTSKVTGLTIQHVHDVLTV